ncbi:hypothetical protein [Desulforamulus putei]|uniref:Uncharacterized protein n=1 Tax=Desulforamulus putei DSM 12395 TaxID=1121429 RepID=A0A1M4Y7A7_9FIRM|nr:hypothetical protein [Desulforamulus putei]SHF01598.1 hypothetical protein SAMN02745133_01626 [Desulforamulus putei DSM 12395]
MSLYISGDKLFEYMVAYILRNNGYIAGVPRRKLGGRGTQHEVGVIGIDLNNSPFCLNTVLLVAARGPAPANHTADMQLVRNLKATLLDLEQTLPSRRELIRDLLDNNRGDLFHRIYGGKKAKETLTVNYVGGVFVAGEFSYPAWEYANAHGIYVVHLPELMAGQPVLHWYRQIRSLMSQILALDGLTLPGLAKKTKKIPDFREILLLLQQPLQGELIPEHSHDLFTIFNELLRTEEMAPLARSLQRTALATINGYPVVIEYNVGYKALLDAALSVYERKIRTIKSVVPATTYKPLDVVHLKVSEVTPASDNQVLRLSYQVEQENVPPAIQNLAGAVYVPNTVLDKRSMKRFRLKMPLKAGLSLVCEFCQETNLSAGAVR